MKKNRDDFSASVKRDLEIRANSRCSNPECKALTRAATENADSGTINIGVAAHICAAAPGGKRYDPQMTSQERASIHNGIWLCQNCAHLIDTDEIKYTIDVLKKWKKCAEKSIRDDLGKRIDIAGAKDKSKTNIPLQEINKLISCLKDAATCAHSIHDNFKCHQIGFNCDIDQNLYNFCFALVDAMQQINQIERRYHVQFLSCSKSISTNIDQMNHLMPELVESDVFGDVGCAVILNNFLNAFARTKPSHFISLCNKTISLLENTYV